MNTQPHDQADGERRKSEVLDLLEAQREVYVRRGRRALLEVLLRCGTATADDVREVVKLSPGINPKLFGSVPGSLARAGIIQQAGFAKTNRAAGHARPVTVWKLADRTAALCWLADHPDLGENDRAADSQRLLFTLNPRNEPGAAGATAAPGMEH
jgi:hypothetical protein